MEKARTVLVVGPVDPSGYLCVASDLSLSKVVPGIWRAWARDYPEGEAISSFNTHLDEYSRKEMLLS
jgi:hypothetical protein